MADSGTVTVTFEKVHGQVRKYTFACTADGGKAEKALSEHVNGFVERLVVQPGTGGDIPTNLFDLTLLDSDGMDVLNGDGANLVNNADTQIVLDRLPVVGKLTIVVNSMGAANKADIILYLSG